MATESVKRSVSVPFLDLAPMHAGLKADLLGDFADLIDTGAFANGPAVAEFEQAFAAYCGVDHCVGMSSGLDALRLALIAAGLEPGDEVIVPAMTFVATAEAVTQAGGRPVFAEVRADDYCLDPEATAAAVTGRTRLIMPVHLYGQMADMRGLLRVAEQAGIDVIEDACQAHGAVRDGAAAGTLGRASAFSFYPGKNLGAMGDAGALVTNDAALAATTRAFREHGQRAKYDHVSEGYTARLDTIQALVLLRKLALLDEWNADRVRVAELYDQLLAGIGDLVLPTVPEGSSHVWHLYVIRTSMRDELQEYLAASGIASGRHYPVPMHLTTPYLHLGGVAGQFPVAESIARDGLSLPIFPGMTDEQVGAVVDAVDRYFT